jgi:CSLREA domain-containing protein
MKKLLGVAVLAFFLMPATAMATVQIAVTTTVDEQSDPGVGCSLREAINSSNANAAAAGCVSTGTPSENKITFSPSLGASPTINLDGALTQLQADTNDLSITGPATVNGDDAPAIRVLFVNGVTLTLNSMTISNGNETSEGNGGGIRLANNGSDRLFLNNSTVSGNKTTSSSSGASNSGAQGGGIFSDGKVTLTNSTVSNNQAIATHTGASTGGAIALGGGVEVFANDLTMENSVASGNQAVASGDGSGGVEADGGGVRNDGEVLIEHSTISSNLVSATATGTGTPTVQGGGFLTHGGGPVDVELTTIANNLMKAPASTTLGSFRGGGINDSSTGTSNYISDTIAGNGLDPASSMFGSFLGLNFRSESGGSRNFSNTIIANPAGSPGTNCSSTPYATSGTPNLDFPQDPTFACFTPASQILNVDPQLGALGPNGGATPTMLPGPTSPVIDQGTASDQNDLTQDQRALTRPVVFPGLTQPFDGSDIGSVEVQQSCPNGFVQSTPSTPCPSSGGGGGGGGGGAGPAPATTTGQRAAALEKCKKKKSKKKRKKCKKKANLLPV